MIRMASRVVSRASHGQRPRPHVRGPRGFWRRPADRSRPERGTARTRGPRRSRNHHHRAQPPSAVAPPPKDTKTDVVAKSLFWHGLGGSQRAGEELSDADSAARRVPLAADKLRGDRVQPREARAVRGQERAVRQQRQRGRRQQDAADVAAQRAPQAAVQRDPGRHGAAQCHHARAALHRQGGRAGQLHPEDAPAEAVVQRGHGAPREADEHGAGDCGGGGRAGDAGQGAGGGAPQPGGPQLAEAQSQLRGADGDQEREGRGESSGARGLSP
mmetsp:Transcript_18684/g.46522  ORF Transcript_18684/g.46522 Transcript_18684/m.46522 type:complete len:272 (-) Transcript_18684:163-978(-)